MKTINEIRAAVENQKTRSAWDRGVQAYALELLEDLQEAADGGFFDESDLAAPKVLEKALLNGAEDWPQYSWGGCALVCDYEVAERLCCPSELKRCGGGERRPNSREEWMDTQARALSQACRRIRRFAQSEAANA